jgi:hypothetical protein
MLTGMTDLSGFFQVFFRILSVFLPNFRLIVNFNLLLCYLQSVNK